MKEILGNILDGADGESEGLDGVDGESKEMEDYEDDDGFVVQIYEDWEENEEQIVVEPDHNLSLISTINIENDSDSAEYAEPDLQTSQHSNNYQNKTLLCEVCNKMFSKRSYYTRHIKIHLGIRRYQCSSCDKSFCSQQNLTIHNRVHTGERPYECVLCAKSFAVQQNLSIHLRSHTGVKPYPCIICDKSFNSKQKLTIHIRTHTGEKPYSCVECSKSFAQREHLVKHYRMHTGERPYKCNMCNKAFASSSHLTRHKKQLHINHPNYAVMLKNTQNSQDNISLASVILNKFVSTPTSPESPVQVSSSVHYELKKEPDSVENDGFAENNSVNIKEKDRRKSVSSNINIDPPDDSDSDQNNILSYQ